LPPSTEHGTFFVPQAFEIESAARLPGINRSMIGAVVGVQPFGGEALSGTGPKAGGPRYLHRFATERTVSTDTTAAGGNATLMSLQEETETVAS
jgi:RHH-type proline utilization regulon transcriptional repressor/proline dehydrogenase/delta 1-pyrroline-5-carboxylate dehydrogenase